MGRFRDKKRLWFTRKGTLGREIDRYDPFETNINRLKKRNLMNEEKEGRYIFNLTVKKLEIDKTIPTLYPWEVKCKSKGTLDR